MTMIIDGTNGLTFNNSTTQASASQILQVVSATTSTATTATNASIVTTTITATITPKFSTSKILVLVNIGEAGATSSAQGGNFWLYKNGSNLVQLAQNIFYNTAALISNNIGSVAFSYSDSPATTSATTYAIYFNSTSGSNFTVQRDNMPSTITLMEIA